jgi:DnaJ-class molecular chaperone
MAKIRMRLVQLEITSVTCDKCKGRKTWRKRKCPTCHGQGTITSSSGSMTLMVDE